MSEPVIDPNTSPPNATELLPASNPSPRKSNKRNLLIGLAVALLVLGGLVYAGVGGQWLKTEVGGPSGTSSPSMNSCTSTETYCPGSDGGSCCDTASEGCQTEVSGSGGYCTLRCGHGGYFCEAGTTCQGGPDDGSCVTNSSSSPPPPSSTSPSPSTSPSSAPSVSPSPSSCPPNTSSCPNELGLRCCNNLTEYCLVDSLTPEYGTCVDRCLDGDICSNGKVCVNNHCSCADAICDSPLETHDNCPADCVPTPSPVGCSWPFYSCPSGYSCNFLPFSTSGNCVVNPDHCGDGACTYSLNENTTSCPADCAPSPEPSPGRFWPFC